MLAESQVTESDTTLEDIVTDLIYFRSPVTPIKRFVLVKTTDLLKKYLSFSACLVVCQISSGETQFVRLGWGCLRTSMLRGLGVDLQRGPHPSEHSTAQCPDTCSETYNEVTRTKPGPFHIALST